MAPAQRLQGTSAQHLLGFMMMLVVLVLAVVVVYLMVTMLMLVVYKMVMVVVMVVLNKVNLVHIGGDEKVLGPHLALGEKAFKQETNVTAKKEHLINTKTN